MKKLLLVAIVAAFATSCRKDRTCTCVTTSDAPGFTSSTEVTTWKKAKKSDAKKACQSYTSIITAPTAGTYHSGADCTLK